MRCASCGRESSGKYCSHCGESLGGGERACASCGSALSPGARFCGECGAAVGARPTKPAVAYLPWMLSGLALVAFAVAISLFVRGQAAPRFGDMPPTGGVIPSPTAEGGAPAGGMPTAAELAAMSPREAADRLFDRAMTASESGDAERASFFAKMAADAYGRVGEADYDLDARFHVGLLRLELGDLEGARSAADSMLALSPDHLLALIVAARAAEAAGDEEGRARYYARFLAGLPAGLASGRPEYEAHDTLLESEAERARQVTGTN